MRESQNTTKELLALMFLSALLLAYLTLSPWVQAQWGFGGILLSQVIFLGGAPWILARPLGLSLARTVSQRAPKVTEILWVALLSFLVIFVVEGLTQWQTRLWPLPESVASFYEELTTLRPGATGALQFLSLVVVPAVCEELFFRGWWQSTWVRRFSTSLNPRHAKTLAALLTALLFAVVHLNPWYFLQYFLLGLFLSLLKNWRGQISLCIWAHFLNNLMSVYGSF